MDFLGISGKLKIIRDYLTTNLSSTRAAKIDYLTANVAVASTAVSNVNQTPTRSGYLDNLSGGPTALRTDPLLSPPIAANWPATSQAVAALDFATASMLLEQSTRPTTTAYSDAVNITGAGVLNFVAATVTGYNLTVKITVDGVAICEQSFGTKHVLIGTASAVTGGAANISLDQIPFRTSLRIETKHTATSGGAAAVLLWKLRRTA